MKAISKQIVSVLLLLISILLLHAVRTCPVFASETTASAQAVSASTEIAPAAEPAGTSDPATLPDDTASAAVPKTEYRHSQIRVTKKGSRADLRTDGAVFTVYTDAACTKDITSYTTNLHGQCVIATSDAAIKPYLPSAGETTTLYLKETKAPAGCSLNSDTYPITISAGADTDSDSGDTSGILSYLICIDNKPEITVINQALEEEKPETPETTETKTTEIPSTLETAQTAETAQTGSTAETSATAQTATTAQTAATAQTATTTQTAKTERSSSSSAETSSESRSDKSSPKTGDSSVFHIVSALISLLAAASALVILLKRKQNDR